MTKIDRRQLLAGMSASFITHPLDKAYSGNESVTPQPRFAPRFTPRFAGLKQYRNGKSALSLLDEDANIVKELLLPERCHGMAIRGKYLIVFARRPGRFFMVVDIRDFSKQQIVHSSSGRHFLGHGTFSPDGTKLFTTENDYATGRGVIGIYDVKDDFRHIAEFDSYGVGPHDIMQMSKDGTDLLVVANGGIQTHPDTPRISLNLASMRPSLAYIDLQAGALLEKVEPPQKWHQLSLRHLSIRPDGLVVVGGQYKGPRIKSVPLVAFHKRGEALQFAPMPKQVQTSLRQYIGSISFNTTGEKVAATSPRGNKVVYFNANNFEYLGQTSFHDVCGLSWRDDGKLLLSGDHNINFSHSLTHAKSKGQFSWDNHLFNVPT